MSTFIVEFKMTDHFDVTVEASSEDEALEKATEIVTQSENPVEEFGTGCDGFQPGLIMEKEV